ncbi:MAG: TRAP transporter TatT component family protein [Deltaproteobacteria bacterium]|nr:TRAP transporter TatT component family protein [Deltaproteobacteria bacterium]
MKSRVASFLLLASTLPLTGCSFLLSSATGKMTDNLSAAVLGQDDPATVRDGAPAYLIALDGLIEGSPRSESLLLAGAKLYGSYAGAFVDDPERASRLTLRARRYGERALCERDRALCEATGGSYDDFAALLTDTNTKDLPALYGLGSAWASWVQANSGDWNAIADLPKLQALMERVVALDDTYDDGSAHLYLGVLYTLRPASLGGKPEQGRQHFERAIEISRGQNLMAKVLFASQYARLVFDRPLHDRLLGEVIEADPHARGFTLSNVLAQGEATLLLADGDDYF